MKSKFQKRILGFAIIIAALLAYSAPVRAAEFFSEPSSIFVRPDQRFLITFYLRSEQSVNAIESKIAYPTDLLDLEDIRDGDSLIGLWVEKPKQETAGLVSYSGIIPDGYQGPKAPLLALVFKAKHEGDGLIRLPENTVLLNDGNGSRTTSTAAQISIRISKTAPVLPNADSILNGRLEDHEPPEAFTISLSHDSNLFDGKLVALFATQDKGSGIDHYVVYESARKIEPGTILPNEWRIAESPYVLIDQTGKSYVYVKAIDKSGNERVAVFSPLGPPFYKAFWFYGILSLFAIILILIFVRKKREKT
ncbi:MAG TPA: cohesin domain-containing protein [Patescibacteria group bacterium]|nr:cohesin domain-containing protein [Patescibacteria group bacterium]